MPFESVETNACRSCSSGSRMNVLNQSRVNSDDAPCIEPIAHVDMSSAVAVFMPSVRRRLTANVPSYVRCPASTDAMRAHVQAVWFAMTFASQNAANSMSVEMRRIASGITIAYSR